MSIKRCPYCKAIIDDSAAYCSNCGTRLLFPEDESIEEDIPGEKILDEDPSDMEIENDSKDKEEPQIQPEIKEESLDLEEIEKENIEEKEGDVIEESEGEEEALSEFSESELEETPPPMKEGKDFPDEESVPDKSGTKTPEPGIKDSVYNLNLKENGELQIEKDVTTSKPLPEVPPERKDIQTGSQEFVPMEEVAEMEEGEGREEEPEKEISSEKDETDYQTGDQMSIFDPIEKEKKDIEQFLHSLREERGKQESGHNGTGTGLPPWAKEIENQARKEEPAEKDQLQETEPEDIEEDQVEEKDESLAQEEATHVEDEPPEQEEETGSWLIKEEEEEIPAEEPAEEEQAALFGNDTFLKDSGLPPLFHSGILRWIKSRFFDVFAVSVVWILTVWLASRILGRSIVVLVSNSLLWMLILLGVFLLQYFFLFGLFLGGTLGDRLFPKKD